MKPSLAICINTFNAQNYIRSLIKKIFNLNLFDNDSIKVYIYDDHSTDKTIDILKDVSYIYPIIYFKNDTNVGILKARDKLREHVIEDYLIFVDHDDFLDNNILEGFYQNYENHDVMILKRCFVYKEKKKIFYEWYKTSNNLCKLQNYYINTYSNYITGIFIKKDIYKMSIFDLQIKEKINLFEDMIFYAFLIYYAKSPIYLNNIYFYNQTNPNSLITSKKDNQQFLQAKYLLIFFNNKLQNMSIDDDLKSIGIIVNLRLLLYMLHAKNKIDKNEFNIYLKEYLPTLTNTKYKLTKTDKLTYYILKYKIINFIYLLIWRRLRYK